MNHHATTRAIAGALIFILAYSPLLGGFNGTVALAQAVQNTTSTYQYDAVGNLIQITDPLKRVSNQSYDALNRLKQQLQPPPASGAARPAIAYTYDGLDQIATVKDPRNLVTSYTTDGIGNQSLLVSPDMGRTIQTPDAAGNVKTRTDARGKVGTYTYDALNRVTGIAYTGSPATIFEYDGGAAPTPHAIGHLSKMTDESGSTSYAYDGFGRLLRKTQTVVFNAIPSSLAVSYVYGASGSATGKQVSITYPSGNRVNYSYDAAGRLSALTLNPVNANGTGTNTGASVKLLTDIRYAPFGAARAWKWGNDTVAQPNAYARTFDLDGRVTSYTLGNPLKNGVLRTVHYDAASRITGTTHAGTGTAPPPASLNQTYGYDGLDRLISFMGAGTSQTYRYDASGNRTAATFGATGYINTIAPTSNRLNATSGPAPAKVNTYDDAGNLSADGSLAYTYNGGGRLSSVKVGAVTTARLYNGLGQRVQLGNGGGLFVYDEQGHLIGEYSNTGAKMTREMVYLGDLPVAVLTQQVSGTAPALATATNVSYIYPDHIGTPRVITRASDNKMVWRWDHADPFGLAPADENPSGLGAFTFNLRMPGQYYDRATNLFYNYYRDYDPQIGRYVQSDPIGLGGGINTYAYVEGNPVSLSDPEGLAAAGAQIGGAIGGAVGGRFGAPGMGRAIGAAAGSAIQDMCSSDPKCDEFNKKVQDAKGKVGKLGACRAGMSKGQLQERYRAWVDLASARAQRDEKCWGGGDLGHQQAQADAWKNVGNCGDLMK